MNTELQMEQSLGPFLSATLTPAVARNDRKSPRSGPSCQGCHLRPRPMRGTWVCYHFSPHPQHILSWASSREQCPIRLNPQQLPGRPLSCPCLHFFICKVGTNEAQASGALCNLRTLWLRLFSPGPTWAWTQWAGGGPRKPSRTSPARGLSPQRTSSSDPDCPPTPVPLWNPVSHRSNAWKYGNTSTSAMPAVPQFSSSQYR